MMVTPRSLLSPITPQNAWIFKAVRLRALEDSPDAFGSTYAKECQLTDADWIQRALRWNGEHGAGFLAVAGSACCGIAGSLLDQADATRAHTLTPCGRPRRTGSAASGVCWSTR